uniref:Uncharacterized protein n=1 Tax=Hanusia phi TaxID=3032 RepID=A0A7S0E9M7_9CRYP
MVKVYVLCAATTTQEMSCMHRSSVVVVFFFLVVEVANGFSPLLSGHSFNAKGGSFVCSRTALPSFTRVNRVSLNQRTSLSELSAQLNHADKIGKLVPSNWKEGTDYVRNPKLAVGDLVFLKRSDGTLRYGEVVAKAGLAWQNSWEVVVQMNGRAPGATRAELAANIFKPTQEPSKPSGSILIGRGAQTSLRQPPPPAPKPVAKIVRPPVRAATPPSAKPAAKVSAPAVGRQGSSRTTTLSNAKAAAPKPTGPSVVNADKLVKQVPATWAEGTEYLKAGSVAPKDFVIIRSSGELKFGEVVAKTGFPWQQTYTVCLQADNEGIVTSTAVFDVKDMYKATDEAVEELMRAKAAPAVGGLFGGLLNNFSPFGGSSDAPKTQKPAASPSPAAPKQAPVKEAPKASAPPSAANAKQSASNAVSGLFGGVFNALDSALPTQSKKETPAPKQSSSTPQTTPPPPAPKSAAKPKAEEPKSQPLDQVIGRIGSVDVSAKAKDAFKGAALNFLNIAEKIIDKVDSEEKPEKEAKVEKKEAPKKSPAPEPVKKAEEPKVAAKESKAPVKPASKVEQPPAKERSEDEVPIAKKRALEVNLKRAEREGDLNLGFGAEWENYIPPDV